MSADRRLRVTQVATSDVGGGAERVAADLHRSAAARGIESRLAVGFRFGDVPGAFEVPNDAGRSAWARALGAMAPKPPAPPGRMTAGARAARRALKAVAEPGRAWRRAAGREDFDYPGTMAIPALGGPPADVLHLHNLHGGYFDLRCLPRLSSQVSTVVTLHDMWLMTGHCAYTLECERWRTGCGRCPHLDTAPAVPRDRTAENRARKADILSRSRLHVVGPSRWVLAKAADSILEAGSVETRLIPNGVDRDVFAPGDRAEARRATGLPADAVVLAFSGATPTSLYKDAATIASALPVIAGRVAPRRVVFLSLGITTDAVAAPGVEVVPVPFLSDPRDVARLLRAADLVLHAARAENHPLAVLEAQSCGVPVVASDVGGIPEALADGETGLLVPAGDPGALAAAASALLLDDVRLRAMGRAAAELAASRFGLDRMADAYAALYREVATAP